MGVITGAGNKMFAPFSDYHLHLKNGILHDMRQATPQSGMDNIISFTRPPDLHLHAEQA